jgi:hypothetical protein
MLIPTLQLSKKIRLAVLICFVTLCSGVVSPTFGQLDNLLETVDTEFSLKSRFQLTKTDIKVLHPMLKQQNEELILALGSCMDDGNNAYMALWEVLKEKRRTFETQALRGLTTRQIKALRSARQESEAEVADQWLSSYLDLLNSSLELDWLRAQYVARVFQAEEQQRLKLLSSLDRGAGDSDSRWQSLSTEREQGMRSILTPGQLREYKSMTDPAGPLIAF